MGFNKTHTRTRENPHPWLRVRVSTGTGAGCPEKPQGGPRHSLPGVNRSEGEMTRRGRRSVEEEVVHKSSKGDPRLDAWTQEAKPNSRGSVEVYRVCLSPLLSFVYSLLHNHGHMSDVLLIWTSQLLYWSWDVSTYISILFIVLTST